MHKDTLGIVAKAPEFSKFIHKNKAKHRLLDNATKSQLYLFSDA